jgi:hypothetical protein
MSDPKIPGDVREAISAYGRAVDNYYAMRGRYAYAVYASEARAELESAIARHLPKETALKPRRDGGGCDLYEAGTPQGDCEGDGHYQCPECGHYTPADRGEGEDDAE